MIVKNEAELLPRCLAGLGPVADELVILDSGSTDGTADVIRAAADGGDFDRVIAADHEFHDFSSAWQASLDRVATQWALCIAADEEVSPALRDRLLAMKADGGLAAHDAWEILWENRILGRVMKNRRSAGHHSLRLFRTAKGRFNEALVHEGIILDEGCTVGRIDEPLRHDTMTSIRSYLRKVDHYTTLEAAMPGDKPFSLLHFVGTGPITFFKNYVLRGGIRDGWPGLVFCAISAWRVVLRDWKRRRRDRRRAG